MWAAAAGERERPGRGAPAQLDRVPERRDAGQGLEAVGKLVDREERAGEQEHRQDGDAHHQRERHVAVAPGRVRGERRGEGQAAQGGGRDGEHAPRRGHGAEQGGDRHEQGGVHERAGGRSRSR